MKARGVLVFAASVLFAQGPIPAGFSGTIDDAPISDKVLVTPGLSGAAVCARLRTVVDDAARQKEQKRLGIVATRAELDTYAAKSAPFNPAREAVRNRARAQVVLPALTEVYDRGQDPDVIFRRDVEGKNIGGHLIAQEEWLGDVARARTPEGRRALILQLSQTEQELASAYSAALAGGLFRAPVERQKLDTRVDQLIGSGDLQFRAYLKADSGLSASPSFTPLLQTAGARYVAAKRAAFWKARVSELKVWLSEPALAQICQLTQMGVVLQRK